ncbi:pyruvate:ferredoxin (flavodoxin) oxidoreductase [Salsipaludibacter albus]|uniref:pyruvate:ferredoxin (flavodoxin) oxidoreductase n=1 Tax=Salsipaludibacter albus TaxID=2849650 RepID=UPI001EE440EA|nr:pyruvate:ferredoxin (flavodoxin) oxidoreductase [Salsipaludibacter albus]MBY5164463.1 pyruvate:ferredoxin (flavodoxin) oxidoreductase [Salsipaludibacter albus]
MTRASIDGNEAAARVAHALSETIAIYPITPASPMGELADQWSSSGRTNLWGVVPRVIEMQSEAGAAGALHGAVTKGTLGTTFTASQGLLLMLPNMFKIAGELTPAVLHVAARTVATHALSIFGDHSDVMAARTTGWGMLAASSVQEAHDMAAVAHAASLESRVPFVHFFDGFRTSHELNEVDLLESDDLAALLDEQWVADHRLRGLDPDRPELRGTAQNPDVFFQAREAANPWTDAVPGIVAGAMDRLADATGRSYGLVEWFGHPEAERAVVMMGSGTAAARQAVDALVARGERVGGLVVRLFRPFPTQALVAALPASVQRIAVLDRTKEPGAPGEPLFTDVATVLMRAVATGERGALPLVVGGRYGLSSKEFTPAMAAGVFAELDRDRPRHGFTVGIVDDVTHTSIDPDPTVHEHRHDGDVRAVFFGLGSDGTVGANKNTVKIVSEHTDLHAQGYFVYDSKKAGARTESHLRFSPQPVEATWLIDEADLVACHQFGFLDKVDVLARARPGATLLLNAPFPADQVWDHLSVEVQQEVLDKALQVWAIDAYAVAREAGLGGRINTVMQPCFFVRSGILPADEALAAIKASVETTYARRGPEVVARNLAAIDRSLAALHRVEVPAHVSATRHRPPTVPPDAPDFVQRVTARIMAGEGDLLPVSALPVDGTFPTGTSRWEKRSIAPEIPIWDPSICIDCNKCAIVCPHAAIRTKAYDGDVLGALRDDFPTKPMKDRSLPDHHLTVQVAPDDCTGCGVCVQVCPATSKEQVGHKAINMEPAAEHRDVERDNFATFLDIPELDRSSFDHGNVRHSQLLQPLFEFSGACAGCGETPYLKLLTQLFGDRMVVANATGCSSIYGANLPATPWSVDDAGRGPAWSNSLFEDNAEFGLGLRLGLEQERATAEVLLAELAGELGDGLVSGLLHADQADEAGIAGQRDRVEELRRRLAAMDSPRARLLDGVASTLVRQGVWIVGGDGWAYDIGYGGLDHVLASGMDVNVLVLDTEVYSNTGGQASKATSRGAVAKFAASGKSGAKKDLGLIAMQYGNVYVAQVALGGNDMQTVRAFREAEAWPGPSLLLAYSTCIAHGVDMTQSMARQKEAVLSGYWPLYRYHPGGEDDAHPFHLDSRAPKKPVADFMATEARFAVLQRSDPERAAMLRELAQADVDERWRYYEQLAGVVRTAPFDQAEDTRTTEEEPA